MTPSRSQITSPLIMMLGMAFYWLMNAHAQNTDDKCPTKTVVNAKGECKVTFPNEAAQGQFYYVIVKAANLPMRSNMLLHGADGKHIGTISPYGKPPGPEGMAFTLSVPREQITNRILNLVISVEEPGLPRRPAKASEVLSIETAAEP